MKGKLVTSWMVAGIGLIGFKFLPYPVYFLALIPVTFGYFYYYRNR